jgi:signal transduction histidine kinase
MRWPLKLWRWFEERAQTAHAAVGFFILLAIAAANYSAGAHITLSMLFLIPVCYFAWFVGFKYGVFGTFLCVLMIAWWRWHRGVFDERVDALIWPSLGRIAVFLFVVLILARLKEELIRQRESNRNLLDSHEEIQKLSKIKDDFTARVSHDLRSPLAAIQESITVVLDGLAGDVSEEQKTYLNITMRSIDRLRRLIDSILDFAQLERGKRTFRFLKCDLRQILEEVVALYRPLAE